VFFRLLRGRADGAVEGAVTDVVVTLIPLSAAAPTTDPPPNGMWEGAAMTPFTIR
jgi:hypothetical protein